MSTPKERHKARFFALQALYQWELSKNSIADIKERMLSQYSASKWDRDYFEDIIQQVAGDADKLDQEFSPLLDRALSELDPVELTVLRIGTYELLSRTDVPYKIVIDEAVRLAKTFGAEGSYKYVNGVLDKLAKRLRVGV